MNASVLAKRFIVLVPELQVVHRHGPEEPAFRAGSRRQSDGSKFYDNAGGFAGNKYTN